VGHDARCLELTEALAEEGPGEAGLGPGDVVEPVVAGEEVSHDQQRPPLTEHLQRMGNGAVLAVTDGFHAHETSQVHLLY